MSVLKHSQQFCLHFQRKIADLVEKERAPVSSLEATDLAYNRAGKSSLFVTEEFTLQESHRNRGAVQLDERASRPSATSVNGRGDQFFASTCLAFDQDRRVRRSNCLDQFQDFHQTRAISYDCLNTIDLTVGGLALELCERAIIRNRYCMTSHKTLDL